MDDARQMLRDLTDRTPSKPLFVSDELPHYGTVLGELFHKLVPPVPTGKPELNLRDVPKITRFYDRWVHLYDLVKSSNSRRANFAIMRSTYRSLNDCEMQRNAVDGDFLRRHQF